MLSCRCVSNSSSARVVTEDIITWRIFGKKSLKKHVVNSWLIKVVKHCFELFLDDKYKLCFRFDWISHDVIHMTQRFFYKREKSIVRNQDPTYSIVNDRNVSSRDDCIQTSSSSLRKTGNWIMKYTFTVEEQHFVHFVFLCQRWDRFITM